MESILHANFVPNDLRLQAQTHRFVLLTGPNMAASPRICARPRCWSSWRKSVRSCRQGDDARHRDRIFTRIGAGDDLASAIHVLHGDGRSGDDLALGDAPLAALDRRSRARTGTLDALHRPGDLRVFARPGRSRADGAVRDAFHELCSLVEHWSRSRTTTSRRREHRARRRSVFSHRVQPGSSSRSFASRSRAWRPAGAVIARAQEIADALAGNSDVEAQFRCARPCGARSRGDRTSALALERIMPSIRVLDVETVGQIRPARSSNARIGRQGIVENAVDAGATRVTVSLQRGAWISSKSSTTAPEFRLKICRSPCARMRRASCGSPRFGARLYPRISRRGLASIARSHASRSSRGAPARSWRARRPAGDAIGEPEPRGSAGNPSERSRAVRERSGAPRVSAFAGRGVQSRLRMARRVFSRLPARRSPCATMERSVGNARDGRTARAPRHGVRRDAAKALLRSRRPEPRRWTAR